MSKRREGLISKRKEKGLLQKDVVKLLKNNYDLKITESYYGMIEQGVRTPSLNLTFAISDIFESKVEDIFFGDKPNKKLRKEAELNAKDKKICKVV